MLIDYDAIHKAAETAKKRFADRYPKGRIEHDYDDFCSINGLKVVAINTAYSVRDFKARYSRHSQCDVAVINDKMEGRLRVVAVYHELGHKILHWKYIDISGHIDRNVFGVNGWMEVEANTFVAEVLLEDSAVIDLILHSHKTFSQIARTLMVPEDFLAFKCRSINHRLGMTITIPHNVSGNCLRYLDNDDY